MPPKPVKREAKEDVVVVDDAGNRLTAPSQKKFEESLSAIDAKIAALKARKSELDSLTSGQPRKERDEQKAALTKRRDASAATLRGLARQRDALQATVNEHQRLREAQAKELASIKARTQGAPPATLPEKIEALEKKLASGTLTLLEERQTSQEVAQLKRVLAQLENAKTKEPVAVDASTLSFEDASARLEDVKKRLAAAEAETASINKQLDAIREADASDFDNRKALRSERDETVKQLSDLSSKKQEMYKEFNEQKATYAKFHGIALNKLRKERAAEAKRIAEEERRAMRTLPKYEAEISALANLIMYLQKTYIGTDEASEAAAAEATKKAEEDKLAAEGLVMINRKGRDEDEDVSFMAPSTRKGKGAGKKAAAAAAAPSTVKLPLAVLDTFFQFKVDPPTAVAAVPDTIKELETIKANFVKKQADEIAKGEAEEAAERKAEEEAARKAAATGTPQVEAAVASA